MGLANGWPPYRIGVNYMDMVACPADSASAQVQRLLKQALDGNGVVAAGRYEHAAPPAGAARQTIETPVQPATH